MKKRTKKSQDLSKQKVRLLYATINLLFFFKCNFIIFNVVQILKGELGYAYKTNILEQFRATDRNFFQSIKLQFYFCKTITDLCHKGLRFINN